MSIQTTHSARHDAADPYTAGHRDAHTEHATGTPLYVLAARAIEITEHGPRAYAHGYWTALREIACHATARRTTESVLAHYEREFQ